MPEFAEVDYIAPRNVVVLANQVWDDESVRTAEFEDLGPGDEAAICEAISLDDDIRFGLDSFGMSDHLADIDNDGFQESIIRYRVERQDEKGGSWSAIPGLNTTYPHGEVGQTVEPFGEVIGPAYGFRIVYENRTDRYAIEHDVAARDIGAQMNLVTVRGER